jgi:hypothetical protein
LKHKDQICSKNEVKKFTICLIIFCLLLQIDFHSAKSLWSLTNSVKFWAIFFFNVLLTVHLSIFISVFNQLDAKNLFYNKFYFMPLHVSSICPHHQEVKIALHSLWCHHTYRWPSRARECILIWPSTVYNFVRSILHLEIYALK